MLIVQLPDGALLFRVLLSASVWIKQVDPDFLLAFFLSPEIHDRVLSIATQTAVSAFAAGGLCDTCQCRRRHWRINGSSVDASAIDDLIENNRRRIEILEEMARLIYREWFVHFRFPSHKDVELVDSDLGPIPEGWKVEPLRWTHHDREGTEG